MFLKFFAAPNGNLVDKALIEFDTIRLRSVLKALPTAILTMTAENDYWPNSPASEDEEADRLYLNGIISLAEMMLEIIEEIYINENVKTIDGVMREGTDIYDNLSDAIIALETLQAAKDVRIAATHAQFGENFGAATGFQTHNYRDDAQKIREFITKGE